MPDPTPKQPENRIHLYDPVGLINDTYGGYRPSNYTVKPRKTVSYNNFVETTNNTNNDLELRSYNSVIDTNSSGGLRSFDTFEIDSFTLRSYTQNTSSEDTTIGGSANSHDDSVQTVVEDRNDGGLKFVVGENVEDDDQSDPSTPRMWSPNSVTSLSFPLNNGITSKPFVNSSAPNPTSSSNNTLKSVDFSPLQALQPTSPKSFNANNSSLNPLNSSNQQNYQNMSGNSRTQAIAKGRRELMDMVRDLPETFYELSLKDIVEQKGVQMEMKEIDIPEDKKPVATKNQKETKKPKKSSKKVKKSESKKMVRSKSVNSGKFFLKTSVFLILGSRKSKKSFSAASSFKVESMSKGEQTSKVGEKEWWRRKSCISSESDVSAGLSSQSTSSRSSTSSSSSRSNSSNGRRSNRFLPNFCLFNGRRIGGKK